jgi:hypothetical protein
MNFFIGTCIASFTTAEYEMGRKIFMLGYGEKFLQVKNQAVGIRQGKSPLLHFPSPK